MSWNLAELHGSSLLHVTLEIALIAGHILLLFSLRSRFGLGLLYVFVGSNQYLQTVRLRPFISISARAIEELDTGGGIAAADLELIFEAFKRAGPTVERRQGGTGWAWRPREPFVS